MLLVVEAEIAENLGAFWIGRFHGCFATKQAAALIKIHGVRDVGRNERVIVPEAGNAVHLDGEPHGNPVELEFARERDCSCCSPTVAIENHPRLAAGMAI